MADEEFTGRYHDGWVSKRFVITLRNIKKKSNLMIYGRRLPYPEQLTISIYVNGNLIHQESNPGGQFTIQAWIPPMIRGNVEIVSSHIFVPKEKGMNEDERKLSFLLDEILVPGLPDLMEPYIEFFDFKPSRKVYFLDEEVWDLLSFLLSETYKIPDKEMLNPLRDLTWWEKVQPAPAPSSTIKGIVYDKFSGNPLLKAKVFLFDKNNNLVTETYSHDTGGYEFTELPPSEYIVKGTLGTYGDQQIRVVVDSFEKNIHIPMLPLL